MPITAETACHGKRTYATLKEAKEAVKRHRKRTNEKGTLHAYRCPYTDLWLHYHIGHKPKQRKIHSWE